MPGIREALYYTTLDEPLDLPARPVAELARWAQQAHEHLDHDRSAHAGRDLGTLLTELHVHAAACNADTRNPALAALVTACHVTAAIAGTVGYRSR